jgi:hypothetical protein
MMKIKTGIWIDSKKAIIVFLEEANHRVKIINSSIEGRERIPGETKWFTRIGNKILNFEKKKKNRRANEIKNYLKIIVDEIRSTKELIIMGPAGMKTELEKMVRSDPSLSMVIRAVENAESMTENQIVARVKQYYLQHK